MILKKFVIQQTGFHHIHAARLLCAIRLTLALRCVRFGFPLSMLQMRGER